MADKVSTSIVPGRGEALPSIEKAHAILAQARTVNEVKKVRVIAQAVATHERGKEIAIDAAAIVLEAEARIGELTREMAQMSPQESGQKHGKKGAIIEIAPFSKRDALEAEGLTQDVASRCERIASLRDEGSLDAYVAACREAKELPTTTGALTLARLPKPERKQVVAKLAEVPSVNQAIREVRKGLAKDKPAKARSKETEPWRNDEGKDVWDAKEFLREVKYKINDWYMEWQSYEPSTKPLIEEIRTGLYIIERFSEDGQ